MKNYYCKPKLTFGELVDYIDDNCEEWWNAQNETRWGNLDEKTQSKFWLLQYIRNHYLLVKNRGN